MKEDRGEACRGRRRGYAATAGRKQRRQKTAKEHSESNVEETAIDTKASSIQVGFIRPDLRTS